MKLGKSDASRRRLANFRLRKMLASWLNIIEASSIRQCHRLQRMKHLDVTTQIYSSRLSRIRSDNNFSVWGSAASRICLRAKATSSQDAGSRQVEVVIPWTENCERAHMLK